MFVRSAHGQRPLDGQRIKASLDYVRRMNRLAQTISSLVLAGLACGDPVNGPPRYTLSGAVRDSVTGVSVQAALVTVGGETVVSDTIGAFAVPVDSGLLDLTISHPGYEELALLLQLEGSRRQEFGLRRLAPYVRDYLSVVPVSGNESGLETALLADLQGYANTDTTRGQAELWFGDIPFTMSLGHESENVVWVYTDSLTVQVVVEIAPGLSSRDSVLWTLFDVDGHTARWLCLPGGVEPECEERF